MQILLLKKNTLLAIAIVFAFSACQKQLDGGDTGQSAITIAASTVASSMKVNTKESGYQLDSGVIAIPIAGSNLSLNYANVPDNVPYSDSFKTPTNLIDFPTATYMAGLSQDILGQNLSINQYFQVSTSSWSLLGNNFPSPINVTVQGFQIDVPVQTNKTNPTQLLVNFPIKLGDSITQAITNSFTLNIAGTVQGFPISGPIKITTTTAVQSKNIADGSLKLKGYTDSLAIVVQAYSSTTTTNFSSTNPILNAALSGILSQVGLTNNQTVSTTLYRFWARGKGLVITREITGRARVRVGL